MYGNERYVYTTYTYSKKIYANLGVIYDQGYFFSGLYDFEINSGTATSNLSYELLGHFEYNKIYFEALVSLNSLGVSSFEDEDAKNGYSEKWFSFTVSVLCFYFDETSARISQQQAGQAG